MYTLIELFYFCPGQRLLAVLRSLAHKKTSTSGATDARVLIFALYKKEASRVEQMLARQGVRGGRDPRGHVAERAYGDAGKLQVWADGADGGDGRGCAGAGHPERGRGGELHIPTDD